MRIVSGTYRGRILPAKLPDGVRPTLDAARESIFNMLQNDMEIDGARVADLFAGSGALAFEALSRGAAHATIVEKQGAVVRCIRENATALGVEQTQLTLVHSDVMTFLHSVAPDFDLIFIDPPYALMALNAVVRVIADRQLLAADGIIVAEHGFAEHVLVPDGMKIVRHREFGETYVDFIAYADGASAS